MRVGKYVGVRAAEKPGGTWSARSFLTGAAVGGALAYLFDPGRWRRRRRRRLLAERGAAYARRGSRRRIRAIQIAVARAKGRTRGFLHRLQPGAKEPPDEVTLVDRVESIVFRDPRFPKGQISINAEQGEVFLRGQVDAAELIQDLEEAVRNVPGVRSVANLLHLPGTAAPTSHAVRHAR
jgi:hypothetical protein